MKTRQLLLAIISGTFISSSYVFASQMYDVSNHYKIEASGFRYDRRNHDFAQAYTITAENAKMLPSGLYLQLDNVPLDVDVKGDMLQKIEHPNGCSYRISMANTKIKQSEKATALIHFNKQGNEPLHYKLRVVQLQER